VRISFFIIAFTSFFNFCTKKEGKNNNPGTPVFVDTVPIVTPLVPTINETSGVADSKKNPGFLWAEEDSGNPPQLSLVGHNGKVDSRVYIKGATNRDWEDMVLADSSIYIADIGDNNRVHNSYTIYKFTEPLRGTDTISTFEKIEFQYPDGSHDAEAFVVDPASKDIFIITKRDNPSRMYRIAYPYSLSTMNTAALIGTMPLTYVVSAALSPDAKEIIIKTYTDLVVFSRTAETSIGSALQGGYSSLHYRPEPQGEAVTFTTDGTGYFTLSEKGPSADVNLYYYKKK
jgi:hypothetical protein